MSFETKTVNRRRLFNAALKGRLWVRCDYRLTDDYRHDAADNFGKMDEFKPVVIAKEGEKLADVQFANPGKVVMTAWHFQGKSGRAWESSGVINLNVHSNLSYTVQVRA